MHNDLAWAVLGVEPSTGAVIEATARLQRIPTGKFLEQLLASAQDAAVEKAAATKRDERLSDLISNMADSLMAAADVVKTGKTAHATSAPASAKAEQREYDVVASSPRQVSPEMIGTEQEAGERSPTSEQLQAWMRVEDEGSVPNRPKTFGRALLRRSA